MTCNTISNAQSRESRQPCITKRFVSISTRLIKGDTVRLIFLTYNDDDDDDDEASKAAATSQNNIILDENVGGF